MYKSHPLPILSPKKSETKPEVHQETRKTHRFLEKTITLAAMMSQREMGLKKGLLRFRPNHFQNEFPKQAGHRHVYLSHTTMLFAVFDFDFVLGFTSL